MTHSDVAEAYSCVPTCNATTNVAALSPFRMVIEVSLCFPINSKAITQRGCSMLNRDHSDTFV